MLWDFRGAGTLLNVVCVLLGSGAGMLLGHRLPDRVREAVTDCLGLVTLLMAALSAAAVTSTALRHAVGSGAPVLVVLGALLTGTITGSLLRLGDRLETLAGRLQRIVLRGESGESDTDRRHRFVEGWLTASLLFCVGPLTVLGSLDDGLGRGIEQLALKSVLDGFAAMAFASTFGVGVLLSAGSVLLVQGSLTLVGVLLGQVLPEAPIDAMTATGGLILAGIGLRLLQIRQVPVADMLPALVVAPLLTVVVTTVLGR